MRLVWVIGHAQVGRFLRDRTSLIWLLVMPLAFTFFMGFAVRGPGGPVDPRPGLRLENADAGFLGRLVGEQVLAQGLREVSGTNAGERAPILALPTNLTARVLALEPVQLEYRPDQEPGEPMAVLTELRVARGLVDLNAALIEYALRHGTNAAPGEEDLRSLLVAAPSVELRSSFAGRRPVPSGFKLSVPGNLVMYLMMNLLVFGGVTLAWERRSGVLRRYLVYPVRRGELVAGKIYGLMLLGAVQIVVLLALGHWAFGVELGSHLPAILVTLGVYAWVAASLGVLIGSLAQAEDKVVGLCLLLALSMAALGGCWWPLELVPEAMKMAAHVVPTGWAMDALHQLITFGGGWAEARGPVGVLVLYGVAANLAAVRWFRV